MVAGFKSPDREIRAGQSLFSPGEPCSAIYYLTDGWSFLYDMLEDGRRQILNFVLPGDVLGFFHPAGQAMTTYGAQALTNSTVCVIPQNTLGPLWRAHPEFGMRLMWLLSRDRNLSYDHLTSVGQLSARDRVAHLLLELFIRSRARWPGHQIEEMRLPVTLEHIGDATGLTAVHVSRVLHELRNDGVLGFRYRRLQILNPDKLVDVAGGSLEKVWALLTA